MPKIEPMLKYVKDDGLPAFYPPDVLVRTAGAVHPAETKGREQTTHPNLHSQAVEDEYQVNDS